jgi:hypothetical protein
MGIKYHVIYRFLLYLWKRLTCAFLSSLFTGNDNSQGEVKREERRMKSEKYQKETTTHIRELSFLFGAADGTCPPAGGAVARKNPPPAAFLTRALQVPSTFV